MLKRSIDITVAILALVCLSPLMLLVAVAIRRDSDGPVLFKQTRVGKDGHRFHILKFRTMRDEPGPLVTVGLDPRITRVGRILRSSKLDELPQFLNVLVGDMSLVGPRPEVPRYVEMWPDEQRQAVLSVRPGITDSASIEFRHESRLLAESDDPERFYVGHVMPRKLDHYCDYVEKQSLRHDLWVLATTCVKVVNG